MKRKKEIRLTPGERKRMLLIGAAILPLLVAVLWIRLTNHSIVPVRERVVSTNGDLYVAMSDVKHEKALLLRVEGGSDEPASRIFVKGRNDEVAAVTLAACRRCNQARRPSYVLDGRLICGHCGEAMPLLASGAPLPKERDCTPIPIRFRLKDASLIIRSADIEASRDLLSVN